MTQVQKEEHTKEERIKQMQDFLDKTEWRHAEVKALQQDASVRQYFRLKKDDGKSAVLMDARPPMDDTEPFELMQKKLDKIGLTVPEIYAIDHDQCFALVEDFGDERYYELVSQGKGDLDKLYELAVDALVHKFFADPEIALEGSEAYLDEYWLFRVEQFLLHYMPQVLGREATEKEREDYLRIFSELLAKTNVFDPVLLHGDFVVQNLYHPLLDSIYLLN